MREALRAGLSHDEIWDLTLREALERIEAAAWRRNQRSRDGVAMAWHAAVFVMTAKAGKLKDLNDYLPEESESAEPVEMTPEQEALVWRLISIPGAPRPKP